MTTLMGQMFMGVISSGKDPRVLVMGKPIAGGESKDPRILGDYLSKLIRIDT